jgi:hypothetical protein
VVAKAFRSPTQRWFPLRTCWSRTSFSAASRSSARPAAGSPFNTTPRNNGGFGLVVLPASGWARINVAIDNVTAEGNGNGMAFANGARAMVSPALIANNVSNAIECDNISGGTGTEVALDNSTVSNNGAGLFTFGGAVLDVSNSNIREASLSRPGAKLHPIRGPAGDQPVFWSLGSELPTPFDQLGDVFGGPSRENNQTSRRQLIARSDGHHRSHRRLRRGRRDVRRELGAGRPDALQHRHGCGPRRNTHVGGVVPGREQLADQEIALRRS